MEKRNIQKQKKKKSALQNAQSFSGVVEHTILEILAGIRKSELSCMCKLIESLGICVHELRADEESYVATIQKYILAKLIVVSEINEVELEELIHRILEKRLRNMSFRGD